MIAENRVLMRVRVLPKQEALLPVDPGDTVAMLLTKFGHGLSLARIIRDQQGRYQEMQLTEGEEQIGNLPRDAEWWVVDPMVSVTVFMNEYARTVMGQPRMMLHFYLDAIVNVGEFMQIMLDACGLPASDDRFWLMGNRGAHVEELAAEANVATLNELDPPNSKRFWQFQVLLERENPLQLGIQRQGWLLLEREQTMAVLRRAWMVLQGTSLFGYADRHFRIGDAPLLRLDDLDCADIHYRRPSSSKRESNGKKDANRLFEFDLRLADGSVWTAWTTSQASAERWVRCLRNASRSPEIVQIVTMADVERIERAKTQLIPVEQILAGLTTKPAEEVDEPEVEPDVEAQLLDRLAEGRTGWEKPPEPEAAEESIKPERHISMSNRLRSDRQNRLDRLQSLEGLVMFNGMEDVELLRDWFECCRTIMLEWLEHGMLDRLELIKQVENQLLLPLQEWRLKLEGRMVGTEPSLDLGEFTSLLRRVSFNLEAAGEEDETATVIDEESRQLQVRFRQELSMMKLCRFSSLSDLDAVVNQAEVCRRRRVNPLRRLTRRLSRLKLGKQTHRTEINLPEREEPEVLLKEQVAEPVEEILVKTPSEKLSLLSPRDLTEVMLSDTASLGRSGGLASPA